MKRILTAIWLAAVVSLPAAATTYYVSSSSGNDLNSGTSQTAPWKTLAKVNATSLAAGDTVLLLRGDTWRESLVPASSGTSSNNIYFDAYGSGPAPVITGYQDLSSASWSLISGNLWQTPVSGSGVNNALFGTIWGQKQSSQAAVQHDRDFYFSSGALYIYSAGNPATYYGSIGVITTAAGHLIYINGKSWLQFQHLSLQWFDGFGVNIAGASDHLLFANMESNGMVPSGTLPHGFYVNATSPADINFYNDEAHLNYDGFRFDGSATAITLVNCKGYANRDGGLVDNTGHATYSYSHFYANSIAILNSQDVQGGATDGGNNLPADTPPAVTNFATYPARLTFTVDDVGFAAGTEAYVDSLIPLFNTRGLQLSAAVVAGYSSALISQIQGWLAAGHDVNSHSWSHQYYTNLNSFTIRYTGTGTAATLSISGNHLTTTVTGGPGGENLNYDLTSSLYDTATELVGAINGHGGYTAALDINCRTAAHTLGLADVILQDIKSATYTALFQKDRLEPDELAASKNWLQTNIPGLTNAKVFVYPDGIEDAQTQGWSAGAGYEGARGALSIGLGSNFIYAKGVNIQNITSLALGGLHSMTAQQIDAKVAALIFKASVWGVPYGLFIHNNDLTTAEVGTVLDSLLAHGAVLMTNTQLMDWLASTANISGTTSYVSAAPGPAPDLHFTKASPVLNAGSNLGSAYAVDLPGVPRSLASSWDIGAYVHLSSVYGTGSGPGSFAIGVPAENQAPIVYGARVDLCTYDPATVNSLTGHTCGADGLALAFYEQDGYPSIPNVGGWKGETLDQAHCPTGKWNGTACTSAVNVTYIDPDFHSANIRATDGAGFPGGISGPSGGDVPWWAADSSAFFVKMPGGTMYLEYFNPATRTVTPSQIHSGTAPGDSTHFASIDLAFSAVNPNVVYERVWPLVYKATINRSTDTLTHTLVLDASSGANCLSAGQSPGWQGNFDVSADDQTFTTASAGAPDWPANTAVLSDYVIMPLTGNSGHYGYQVTTAGTTNSAPPTWPQVVGQTVTDGTVTWTTVNKIYAQEQGFDIVSYTIGRGCRYLNTLTGKVRGDWGCSYPVGSTSCSGPAAASIVYDDDTKCGANTTCSMTDRITLHGVNGINAAYAHISRSGCPTCTINPGDTYFWDIGTNAVRPCYNGCDGHQAKGNKYEFRGSAALKAVLYGKPDVGGSLNPGTVVFPDLACDDHGSYNNANENDQQPFLLGTVMVPTPRTGTPSAFCNEVVGATTDGSQKGYRFASNFNSGSESSFQTQNAIGVVSPDGKWFLRVSDMMGTLGSTTGGSTCNQLRADSIWKGTTAFATGARVLVISSGYIYEATTGGTSAGGTPTWSSCTTVGCTLPDGTITWTNRGKNDCAASVFITDLVSAH